MEGINETSDIYLLHECCFRCFETYNGVLDDDASFWWDTEFSTGDIIDHRVWFLGRYVISGDDDVQFAESLGADDGVDDLVESTSSGS